MPSSRSIRSIRLGLVFIFLISTTNTFAQDAAIVIPKAKPLQKRAFFFSLGVNSNVNDAGNSAFAMQLYPRYNVLSKYSDFSISIDAPLAAGYSPNSNDPLFYEVPLFVSFNFGNLATKNFYKEAGFALGVEYNSFRSDNMNYSGIALSASFRSWLFGTPLSFRYAMTSTNDKVAGMMHELGLGFCLGNWVRENRRLNKVSNFSKPFR